MLIASACPLFLNSVAKILADAEHVTEVITRCGDGGSVSLV